VNNKERKAYARFLAEQHAKDVEYLTLFEMFDQYAGEGAELSDEDGQAVADLIGKAKVTISWPDEVDG
jgi:hypothetical protein